jgi:transcriptional regulator with PAS, ATPase and Fis domain
MAFQQYAHAQEEVNQVQPSIMVVPWVSQEENIIDKLDNDFTYAAVLNKIKEAFNNQGFYTYDFITAYNNAQIDKTLKWDKLQTVFQEIASNTPCEIYVKSRINIERNVDGSSNKIDILLEAVNNYSNLSIANVSLGKSNRTNDIVLLAQVALEQSDAFSFGSNTEEQQKQSTETFLDQISGAFQDMRKNGRIVRVDFSVEQNSDINYDTEVGENYDMLSDLILEWLKKQAYKDYVKDVYMDESNLKIEMKVPLRDKDNTNYNVSNLGGEIRSYVASLGLQTELGERLKVSRQVRGSTINIIIKSSN